MPFDDPSLLSTLRERFGHGQFRPGQKEVIHHVLEGRPTLAVMPTGQGKSLCYQLPALLLNGTALVVSPLVALMKDQVDGLQRRGVSAAYVNSSQPESTRSAVERDLGEGRFQLVYVAPERFRSTSFRRALSRIHLSLFAVDEAHCVSEWGHAFRPDYALLGQVLSELAPPRVVALTATATPDVRQDIVRALRMRRPALVAAGFDRENLHFEAHEVPTDAEKKDTVLRAVRQHQPAIVYTATRRQAEAIARHLSGAGTPARAYHAGLDNQERREVQDLFQRSRLDVVVATNAFGLGVDKPDVRMVIHADLPRSVEAYYQEAGRAGRDGQPALAVLLFSPRDILLQRRLLSLATPPARTVAALYAVARRTSSPLDRERLMAGLKGRHSPAGVTASLAFLESLGILERRSVAGPLRLRLRRDCSPDGETAASAVARLLGGGSGVVEEEALSGALGITGRRELESVLTDLERRGELRVTRVRPRSLYRATEGATLQPQHLRRLRIRSGRDEARLQALIRVATEGSCRRRGLLAALGEEGRVHCSGCDICSGARLRPVRSMLRLKGISSASFPAGADG